jgi:hypothetical protein
VDSRHGDLLCYGNGRVRRLLVLVLLLAAADARAARSIAVAGYLGHYDPATVAVWPERLQLLLGSVYGQGGMIAEARRRAAAAGNPVRFVFYLSLSSLDGGCGCWEADLLKRFQREHPAWVLRARDGSPVSTFIGLVPRGRQLALDLGNPDVVDAWADAALAVTRRQGWDGVYADNVIRGRFDGTWSAVPVNARTGREYTEAEYRDDMLAALRRLRGRFDAARKLLIGNHGSAWRTFADEPVLREQVLAMHGVQVEDFAYTFGGAPQPEADWLRQIAYLDFAGRHGVLTWAHGGKGALMDPDRREYVLASYLIARRGDAVVGDLNAARTWWPALATDLGAAKADFVCLDPGAGFAPGAPCPAPGRVFARDFAHARVLVNPTTRPLRVPLGGDGWRSLDGQPAPDPLRLPGQSGRILVRRDQTASRSSSGVDER